MTEAKNQANKRYDFNQGESLSCFLIKPDTDNRVDTPMPMIATGALTVLAATSLIVLIIKLSRRSGGQYRLS